MNKACIASPLNRACSVCSMLVAIFDDLCGEVSYHFWKPFTSPQLYLGNLGRLRSKKFTWLRKHDYMDSWTESILPKKSPSPWSHVGKAFPCHVSLGKSFQVWAQNPCKRQRPGCSSCWDSRRVEIRAMWRSSRWKIRPRRTCFKGMTGIPKSKMIQANLYSKLSFSGYHWRESPVDRIIRIGFQIWISKTWNLLVSSISESLKPEICWFPHFETPSYDDRFKVHSSQSRLCTSLKFIFFKHTHYIHEIKQGLSMLDTPCWEPTPNLHARNQSTDSHPENSGRKPFLPLNNDCVFNKGFRFTSLVLSEKVQLDLKNWLHAFGLD